MTPEEKRKLRADRRAKLGADLLSVVICKKKKNPVHGIVSDPEWGGKVRIIDFTVSQ